MDAKARECAALLVCRAQKIGPSSRLLVGISGIPASGKSQFAQLVAHVTNTLLHDAGAAYEAVLIGLDGWHLTRAQLDAFPHPKLAHDRRGSHWTFDGNAYVEFVKSLREPLSPGSYKVIMAPSFDHALKDPTPHAISILPCHRIVVIEGLYTCLATPPWETAAALLDERWILSVDISEAERRLVKRHVLSGVAKDHEEAVWRANENDIPNGRYIFANSLPPTLVIESVDDPALGSPS
ncbi:P-loop containing nucleoside triphosphate hydrolase protein [Fistulina hepatica ATCC 64428]|uniref:p-loop containing nucleoside triphosphate hydrolase protein n=1 Tax=Fistulina hepatica ATCC 64428 TaxID=1128425 RepID=A0A0D7A7J5_9AGAR|nr:P-loop containing nucleoside triphosphate hydrolase protein [Fistulina hepatica ATCC 64428]